MFVGVARLIGTLDFHEKLTPDLRDFLGFDVLVYLDRRKRQAPPRRDHNNKTFIGISLEPECLEAPGKPASRSEVAWSYHVTLQVE